MFNDEAVSGQWGQMLIPTEMTPNTPPHFLTRFSGARWLRVAAREAQTEEEADMQVGVIPDRVPAAPCRRSGSRNLTRQGLLRTRH